SLGEVKALALLGQKTRLVRRRQPYGDIFTRGGEAGYWRGCDQQSGEQTTRKKTSHEGPKRHVRCTHVQKDSAPRVHADRRSDYKVYTIEHLRANQCQVLK